MVKNNNLIGISGRIGHGKDTVGNIIQILTALPHLTDTGVKSFLGREIDSPYKIKKFADKLKDMVCLLIGCSREQLECREFKEKELGEEWWYWKYLLHDTKSNCFTGEVIKDTLGRPKRFPLLNYRGEQEWKFISDISQFSEKDKEYHNVSQVKLTPRLLLQLLGTECGRQIIHPNIWVNSLFAEYKTKKIDIPFGSGTRTEKFEPKWIITDLRFPNEFEAVKDRGGITIRVNREIKHQVESLGGRTNVPKGYFPTNQHPSETALDNETRWDYVIDNNSTIEDLIKKVREILNKENII